MAWFRFLVLLCAFCIFFVSLFAQGIEPHCELQPRGYTGDRASLRAFEKNIENKMSSIYHVEYPKLHGTLQEIQKRRKLLTVFENRVLRLHLRSFKGVKHTLKNRSLSKKSREYLLNLLEKNLTSRKEFHRHLRKSPSVIRSMSFDLYRQYTLKLQDLKHLVEEVQHTMHKLKSPHFLYVPKFDFSLRGGGHAHYGNLQVEGFFWPPKENLLQLPFLNIGFETNQNTIIYLCTHIDAYDSHKNFLYLYFLNTTKLYTLSLKSVFLDSKLLIKHLLTFRSPPKATVSPLPFVLNPFASTLHAVGRTASAFQHLTDLPLTGIMGILNKVEFLSLTANLNPLLRFAVDNIDIGINGLLIQPGHLTIRYAASTLYGLVNFNLIPYRKRADFNFMNVMTLKQD